MKYVIHIIWLLLIATTHKATAQIVWQDSTTISTGIKWSNYSTSYVSASQKNIEPMIVIAIPYNGKHDVGDYDFTSASYDVSFTGSLFRFRSALVNRYGYFPTYDSAEVYFMTANVYPHNAALYEYQVLLNGTTILTPWTSITRFTDDKFQLNNFDLHMGWIGGYKTTWNNQITVTLRKKNNDSIVSAIGVRWKNAKPLIRDVYTTNELNRFLKTMKAPYMNERKLGSPTTWTEQLGPGRADTAGAYSTTYVLPAGESNLIVHLQGDIFQREALEYTLIRNGTTTIPWRSNEFDNNFFWLMDLDPGSYELHMRFRAQRHNISRFAFKIQPAWYQTLAFKTAVAFLILIIIGFIYLLFRLSAQKRKTATEQLKQVQLKVELQSVYAQLNPHFIFNALHSIQGLINTNDVAGANRYLAEFGNLVRDSLAAQGKDMVPLYKELHTLDTYLQLEQLRFGFQYKIHVDEKLSTYEVDMPTLLLQPLIENSVKHGISALQNKGMITVQFTAQQQDMHVKILDNGTGFDTAADSKGLGLQLTRSRIQLLNNLLAGESIEMTIESKPETGTTVSLLFKNWLA